MLMSIYYFLRHSSVFLFYNVIQLPTDQEAKGLLFNSKILLFLFLCSSIKLIVLKVMVAIE